MIHALEVEDGILKKIKHELIKTIIIKYGQYPFRIGEDIVFVCGEGEVECTISHVVNDALNIPSGHSMVSFIIDG